MLGYNRWIDNGQSKGEPKRIMKNKLPIVVLLICVHDGWFNDKKECVPKLEKLPCNANGRVVENVSDVNISDGVMF